MPGNEEAAALGVAELCRKLRGAVEAAFSPGWVHGEVGTLRWAASGHVYFALKDAREDAVVQCVMYRFYATRARRVLEEGANVQVLGRASVWAPAGRLQLTVEAARQVGKGEQLEALRKLKERLTTEGVLDPAPRRPLPASPRCIGIVTSAHGAAWHDIRVAALRRSPVKLVLCPAQVQGSGAPQSLVAALQSIARYPGIDVVVLGRGGGSDEDLNAFNDERVVRIVAACPVPVVSAVGHELDYTLTDWAADARAATPTAAMELVVPELLTQLRLLDRARERVQAAVRYRLQLARSRWLSHKGRLGDPRFVLHESQQRVDELQARMERWVLRGLQARQVLLVRVRSRLLRRQPLRIARDVRARLGALGIRLQHLQRAYLERSRERHLLLRGRLEGLSPLAVLARGYAIVFDRERRAVRSAAEVRTGDELEVRLERGALHVEVRATVRGGST